MKGKMVHSHRRGHIRIPVIWGRAKNERGTGVVDVRLWRGNQRRVTLYCISDLSFYKFWERAWKIFERIREEEAMTDSPYGCYLPPLQTVFSHLMSWHSFFFWCCSLLKLLHTVLCPRGSLLPGDGGCDQDRSVGMGLWGGLSGCL